MPLAAFDLVRQAPGFGVLCHKLVKQRHHSIGIAQFVKPFDMI